MRTIFHISDVHFGPPHLPRVSQGVLEHIERYRPSMVVLSGDLTQRAKQAQFEEARDFLARLAPPRLVVPGNHDVPLYRVWERFLSPLGKYCRIIDSNLEPTFVDGEIAVVGVNTARSLTFKGGRINREQIESLRRRPRRGAGWQAQMAEGLDDHRRVFSQISSPLSGCRSP